MMNTIRARWRTLLQRLLRLYLEQKFNLIFMWKVIISNPDYNSPIQNRIVGNSSYVQSLSPPRSRVSTFLSFNTRISLVLLLDTLVSSWSGNVHIVRIKYLVRIWYEYSIWYDKCTM